jgi:hypothetical protein
MCNIPFEFNPQRYVVREEDATLKNVICNDLSVNGTLTYNEAIVEKNKTINGDLRVYGDTSLNTLNVLGLMRPTAQILDGNIVGNDKNISGLNKLTATSGNITDFSCTNLDVSSKVFINDLSAIKITATDLSATNLSSTDLSVNTLFFAKQGGINVVNGESYATGNNVLRIAGHTNITNFVDDMTATDTAQLVIGKVSSNQYIKFKTEKTGTGIGASSIDFDNINADATDVNYLAFKNDGTQVAYINNDGKMRMKQLEVKIDSNTGTYLNFRDNVGDTADNDIMTIRSGVDPSEFPSAHYVDISAVGDYSAGNSEFLISTDKNKASFFDISNIGIGTKTPTEKLEVNGNIKGSDLFMTNGFCDTSFCIGSSPHKEFQFEVKGGSNFAVNTQDSEYVECGNLKSSGDVLDLVSFGNVEIICDANGNSSGKSIKFMSNGRLGTGNNLMKIEEDGVVKIGDFDSNSDMLLSLNGNAGRNGVLQIVSRSDGGSKEIDGIAFKPTNNGNNIINFQNTGGNDRAQIKGNGGSAVQYQTGSDRRLKTNIVDMSSQLQNIMDLQPKKYNWIEDNEEGYGFIAQEVHSVFPQMRDKFEETYCSNNPNYHSDCPCDASGKMFYYGLDYGNFTPYIIKAFQEFKSATDLKISELESLIANNKTATDISINSLETNNQMNILGLQSQIAIADISINNLQTQNSLFTEHTAITDVSINTLNSQVIVNKNLLLTLIDDNS